MIRSFFARKPRTRFSQVVFQAFALSLLAVTLQGTSWGQEGVIDFGRDVKPILESRCFRCHGGDSTEGLDLNDAASLSDYLVAHEPDESDFFQRVIADDDSIMPPLGEGGPLAGSEIATLKLWIEEGATWPEGTRLGVATDEPVVAEPQLPAGFVPFAERSLLQKVWGIHGWFHPAVVHFPIALFTVGALFVGLNWLFKGNFREMAFWCLLIGSIGSIAACTMGWAFAAEKSASGDEIFWHRWGGIIVAGWSTLVTILALRLKSSDKGFSQFVWQAGLLLSAAMVGMVGHQGGELVYGEHMYEKAIQKYFPEFGAAAAPVDTTSGTDSSSTSTDSTETSPMTEGEAGAPTGDEQGAPTPSATETSDTPPADPSTDTPATETPGTETPGTGTPGTETPSTQTPATGNGDGSALPAGGNEFGNG